MLELAGAVPSALAKLSLVDSLLAFGHGLAGLVPRVQGTITAVSLFNKQFEDDLPEMRLSKDSKIL
eukprot:5727720-Amphidinium_carterae.2